MALQEILRSYETLKSYGLIDSLHGNKKGVGDVITQKVRFGSVEQGNPNGRSDGANNRQDGLEIDSNDNSKRLGEGLTRTQEGAISNEQELLVGSTEKQLGFLSNYVSQQNDFIQLAEEQRGHQMQGTGLEEGTGRNTISASPLGAGSHSFMEALIGKKQNAIEAKSEEEIALPLKPLNIPRIEGGNLVVELDEAEYKKGVDELIYSVVGKLFLQKSQASPTTMALKAKLESTWGLNISRFIPMGGGYYHVLLQTVEEQSIALAHGPVILSPGIFRVARWQPGFDPICLKTTTQIWTKFYGIPLEFRKNQNLLNIVAAVGTPLRFDAATRFLFQGLYARVLVDIDVSKRLPDRILASLKTEDKATEVNFFVTVSYENLPKFCSGCRVIGHDDEDCRKQPLQPARNFDMGGDNRRRREDVRRRTDRVGLGSENQQRVGSVTQQQAVTFNKQAVSKQIQPEHGGDTTSPIQQNMEQQIVENDPAANFEPSMRRAGELRKQTLSLVEKQMSQVGSSTGTQMEMVGENVEGTVAGKNNSNACDAVIESPAVSRHRGNSYGGSATIDTNNRYETLDPNASSERIARLFPEDVDSVQVREEIKRKEMEWEKTKARLEARMQEDMKKNREMSTSSTPPPPPPPPPKTKRWYDSNKEDEAREADEGNLSKTESGSNNLGDADSLVPETQEVTPPILDSDPPALDPEKIYWDEDNEVYFHTSGMHYDPEVKTYYSLIDQKGGDLRPTYYVQAGGDFFVAQKGKLGQSNKVLMDDKSWSKQAIYSIKSPRYKHGLLKMFKEKVKEGTTS